MGLVDRSTLIAELGRRVDKLLATQLVDEFISLERRYVLRDWEPTSLDGGQFCEIAARIIYAADSGNLSLSKDFKDCCGYIEEEKNNHSMQPRHDALHLAKVLRTAYKFRSQRGAVHISPTYGPNHMDSRFLVESARWAMMEILRLFWSTDREGVAKAVRELLHFDVPCIGRFEQVILVQRTDLATDEELLVLLHYAGEQGFTRKELGEHAMRSPPRISEAIAKLTGSELRQVILVNDRLRLTDLGAKRVRERLAEKLVIE